MQALNKKLATATYVLPGSTTATQADLDAFETVDMQAVAEFPHVLRWASHISALRSGGFQFPARPAAQPAVFFSGLVGVRDKKAKGAKTPGAAEKDKPAQAGPKAAQARKQVVVDVAAGVKPADRKVRWPEAEAPSKGSLATNLPGVRGSGATKKYVTTAINYTNGWGHIGHAYEALTADVMARWYRLEGNDTYFVTGTDEHGQKIAAAAEAQGRSAQDVVDTYAEAFRALNQRLLISNDFFVRTTQAAHKETCRELWRRCRANGDIYLDTYEGYYLVREERFVTEAEAKEWDYKDPQTGLELKKMRESSYFFRMSKYHDWLLNHLQSSPDFVQPTQYLNQVISRLESDRLRDLSISRCTFNWGVPAPEEPGNGEDHVMYVWFDALTNYLSAVDGARVVKGGDGESIPPAEFNGHWPPTAQVVGKDITWFHCVIWPCMLKSAGIEIPETVAVHGFISAADGRKMSKSFGTVVDPHDLLDTMAADTLRWYMCRDSSYGDDLKFSVQSLKLMHNSDLVSNLGNFVSRAVALSGGAVPARAPAGSADRVALPFDWPETLASARCAMEHFELSKLADVCVAAAAECNRWVQEEEPWKKVGEAKADRIRVMLESCVYLAHLFAPFCPQASAAILKKLGWESPRAAGALSTCFENLADGAPVVQGSVVFQPFMDLTDALGEAAPAAAAPKKGAK